MKYLIVQKEPIVIIDEMTLPIPMSHLFETDIEAKKWMFERGMQKDCKVMSVKYFQALGGVIQLPSTST